MHKGHLTTIISCAKNEFSLIEEKVQATVNEISADVGSMNDLIGY